MIRTLVITVFFGLVYADMSSGAETASQQAAYAQGLLDHARRKDVALEISDSLGHREAFRVEKQDSGLVVRGGSAAGLIYGVQALLDGQTTGVIEKPDFAIRGTTLCLMRNPAGRVAGMPPQTYASVLSRETLPWFYDKQHLERFLDAMVAARLNTLFVWSGHLFPYILEMPKYPEACELTKEQLRENQEQFRWFTQQCARRNISVLLHFYNIHVSKPMAEAHHFKPEPPKFLITRPSTPTPLLKDYVRYALSRFFEEFDSVGLYVCPGESLKPEFQLEWFRDVIFAAAKASGKDPLLVIRDWHLSGELRGQLKTLYPNIYSEMKQNNESLTSPVPDRLHAERWKGIAKAHVVNLHGPPMDLQPMRWGSPLFIREIVSEWKKLGFVDGAELYTLSFWLWPYTRDKLEPQQEGPVPSGRRLLWLDRDSIYLDAFGRYLWQGQRDPEAERAHWEQYLAAKFGSPEAGRRMYRWYVLTGPISPGMLNLTATKFQNHWSTVVLQNQGVDFILKARKRIDDVPTADSTKSMDHCSMPVDTYFFERYKSKYGLPQLTQRVSMPVAQYATELSADRQVTDAMPPDRVCDLLCQLAGESLKEAQAAQAEATDPAAREELGRFATDSQMYVLATEALRQKVLAALVKGQMLASGDRGLAKSFIQHMENSVAVYEKLAELTSRTYLSGNDLWPWKHWKKEGIAEFKADLQAQTTWLNTFLVTPPSKQ
jgi:hypothetical protein